MSSPRKMRTSAIYSALNALCQGFEQALSAMDTLTAMKLKNEDIFDGCRIMTEEAAAWACYQVIAALEPRELRNWALSGEKSKRWHNRHEEPDELPRSQDPRIVRRLQTATRKMRKADPAR